MAGRQDPGQWFLCGTAALGCVLPPALTDEPAIRHNAPLDRLLGDAKVELISLWSQRGRAAQAAW